MWKVNKIFSRAGSFARRENHVAAFNGRLTYLIINHDKIPKGGRRIAHGLPAWDIRTTARFKTAAPRDLLERRFILGCARGIGKRILRRIAREAAKDFIVGRTADAAELFALADVQAVLQIGGHAILASRVFRRNGLKAKAGTT